MKDPQKRAAYDQFGSAAVDENGQAGFNAGGFNGFNQGGVDGLMWMIYSISSLAVEEEGLVRTREIVDL